MPQPGLREGLGRRLRRQHVDGLSVYRPQPVAGVRSPSLPLDVCTRKYACLHPQLVEWGGVEKEIE
jgi:hypothetical protein